MKEPQVFTRIDWPDFGTPALPNGPGLSTYEGRLAQVRAAMLAQGLDALVIYGDREHCANLHWLTGFDPRFEEAVLVILSQDALLLAGNECLPYTGISPLVGAGIVRVGHCASLSLPDQPRGGQRLSDWLAGLVPIGGDVGAVGWKWFAGDEVDHPETSLDLPAFIADPLRRIAGRVVNATPMFQHAGHGLRSTIDAAEIARLEFANHMAASALRRMLFGLREGMRDFDAVQGAQIGGLPLGCHVTFATGTRAEQGLSGPSGQHLTRGTPLSFNICHWGANICRAGWLAHEADDLPTPARDYIEAFALPYLRAMSEWCALMRPGVAGGAIWAQMRAALPFDTFAVTLNPGHLIGLEEWMSSPIYRNSALPLRSGMAMQCDVIPAHPIYGSTRMEDGYVIADADLRADLAASFPVVAARVAQRQEFMRRVIGLDVPDSLLPLADTCGIIAPYLFAPQQVLTLLSMD